ncbi:MAG: glycerate 2-kinase [Gaiellaceae bacterium]|nr:glycerate 2-kinase [Gaiellaceae bacterium]
MDVLVAPASLKGVLGAIDAGAALATGVRAAGGEATELPVADGGDGTLAVLYAALGGDWREAEVVDAFGRPRKARWLALPDGTAAVESAQAIPLDPERLDPVAASSEGLGLLIRAVGAPPALLVGLGGTANVDGGRGLRAVLDALPAPTRVLCDVDVPLVDAARVFAAQKGARPEQARELERRLRADQELAPFALLPGAGAAGGLGAALAALGADLVSGAEFVLSAVGFDPAGYDLVVTGEGAVDATTLRGKAPGAVVRRCGVAGVPCVVFGGRVDVAIPGAETVTLSGDPARAPEDLRELGVRLAAP